MASRRTVGALIFVAVQLCSRPLHYRCGSDSRKRGIELIWPYQSKQRRYNRRWIVERTNARLGQFRRRLVRCEHPLSTYRAFFYVAYFWITLRHYF